MRCTAVWSGATRSCTWNASTPGAKTSGEATSITKGLNPASAWVAASRSSAASTGYRGTGSLGRGLYRCDIMGTGTGERMQVAVIDLPSALIHLQQPAALPAGCRRIIRRLREYKNSQDHRYKKKDQGDKYPCTPPLHLASPPYNIVLG